MQVCDVAVVGLGLIGSSAFHSLVRCRADALGFDPLVLGEARGSSHGSCRVCRRFNFESAAYTDLSDAAFKGWRMLKAASGRTILMLEQICSISRPTIRTSTRVWMAPAGQGVGSDLVNRSVAAVYTASECATRSLRALMNIRLENRSHSIERARGASD